MTNTLTVSSLQSSVKDTMVHIQSQNEIFNEEGSSWREDRTGFCIGKLFKEWLL